MKTFFKVVIWIAAVFLGLFVWNGLPDFRPLVSSILAAAFVCYVLSIIVEATVKRVISNEQMELRLNSVALDDTSRQCRQRRVERAGTLPGQCTDPCR